MQSEGEQDQLTKLNNELLRQMHTHQAVQTEVIKQKTEASQTQIQASTETEVPPMKSMKTQSFNEQIKTSNNTIDIKIDKVPCT